MQTNVFKIDTDVTQSGAHVLQAGQDAKFSFGPEDISGIQVTSDGSLVISFVEGGELTIKNFASLADSGATLTLADGTVVNPAIPAQTALAASQAAENDNHMLLDMPSDGTIREITLEPGQQYIVNFDFAQVVESKANLDGSYILTFKNGARLVLSNYEEAMAWDNHPIISADPFITTASNDALLTNIEKLVFAAAEKEAEDEQQLAQAAKDAADTEPAAGEGEEMSLDEVAVLADMLAEVEPAAGDDAGGRANSGYGYNSTAAAVPLGSIDAVGPLGRTLLNYGVNDGGFDSMYMDDNPEMLGNADNRVLEEGLDGGPLVATGTIAFSFGNDGAGSVGPNGSVVPTGSLDAQLTSGGHPVEYHTTSNGYEGIANGQVVFTLEINPLTGSYVYTQHLPLDHADETSTSDEITIHFGIVVRDSDGDTVNGTVRITIVDDGPAAHMAISSLDEADIGPAIVTGNLVHDYGADDNGALTTSGAFRHGPELSAPPGTGGPANVPALTSGGVAVTVTQTATGYIGMAGGVAVFTLHVNLETGHYTYTQLAPLDHPDANDTSDVISLYFGMTVTDGDGDSVPVDIRIDVIDDAPVAVDEAGAAIEDQTITGNLMDNDMLSVDGNSITQVAFKGAFYDVPAGGSVNIIGDYGIITVWSNGDYSYTADHWNPDGTDSFTYTLTDGDGDQSTANLNILVTPIDDIPTIIPDADNQIRVVDETDLTSGVQIDGIVRAEFYTDGPGTFTSNGNFNAGGSLANGNLTFGGLPIVVTLVGDTYVGAAGGVTVFTMKFELSGEYSFNLLQPLDHADTSDHNDDITLEFGFTAHDWDDDTADGIVTVHVHDDGPLAVDDAQFVEMYTFTITGNLMDNDDVGADGGRITSIHFNGVDHTVPATGSITINSQYGQLVIASNGDYTYTVTDENAPDAVDVYTYTLTDGDGDTDTATGTFTIESRDNIPLLVKPDALTLDESGLDDAARLTVGGQLTGEFYDDGFGGFSGDGAFSAGGSLLGGALTHHGVPVTVTFNATTNTYVGSAGGVTVFTLAISHSGVYTFVLHETLDHADPNDPDDIITLEFGAKGNDLDDDAGHTTITIDVKDSVPTIGGLTGAVDETNARASGSTSFDGQVTASGDGIGSVAGTGFFGSAGSTGAQLTSGGQAITVTLVNGVYIGTAGGATVFTLTVNANGSYNFSLFKALDHADTASANDVIRLNFGIEVTDADGDKADGIITINVADDGPVAVAEAHSIKEDQSVSGNILSNDTAGFDGVARVTSITFNGATHALPANGSINVTGALGILTIHSNGTYTYQANTDNPNGTDSFGYTMRDGDGDTATSTLSVAVIDTQPVARNDAHAIKEAQSASGNVMNNDTIGADGGGHVVSVTFNGQTHNIPVGGSISISGALGTLTISSNGAYTYQAVGVNPNGTDSFTYTMSDVDGDRSSAILSVNVTDSQPIARNDSYTVAESTLWSGGAMMNVMANDTMSADGGTQIISAVFVDNNGASIQPDGWWGITYSVAVVNGQIRISSNGDDGQFINRTFNIRYTIRDVDGDVSTAVATVTMGNSTEPPPPQWWGGDGGGDGGGGSPLVLDLDGDGIELTKLQDGVQFDVDDDGVMDQVSWVSADDALLGIDLNGDGIINGHSELFGRIDQDGFNVLADYNTNGDGKIDKNDADWSKMVAWRDLNQDGISTADEIFTLDELGITSISLATQATDFYLSGSWIPYTSTFTYADGTTHSIADVWFTYLTVDNWMSVVNAVGYDAAVEWLDTMYQEAADTGVMPNFDPDAPIIMGPVEKIYEDDVLDGFAEISDDVKIFYGDDQPGEMTGNGKFHSTGAMVGGILMHQGVAIEVGFNAETGLYTGLAGDKVVFTMQINADGSYDFKMYGTLDHMDDISNLNNTIVLQFGVAASDHEGDVSEGVIRLQIANQGGVLGNATGSDGDLYGGAGADTFLFQTIQDSTTTIHNFNTAEGDAIDMSNFVFTGDNVTDAIGDFVHARTENGSTIISVDLDGAGAGAAIDIVQIDNVTGLDVQEMLNNGNLII